MGAVLAMRMTRLRHAFAALGLLGLAACGTEQSAFLQQASQLASSLISGPAETGPSLRERLTPEALATLDGPILIIELPNTASEAGAQLQRRAGRVETWSTLNGVQFTFDQGLLLSTRGLGGDLMSADLGETKRAFAAGHGEAVRVHRYLDGEDQEVARAYVCTWRSAGRVQIEVLGGSTSARNLVETCTSSTETVENQYWIDSSGKVRRSVQWVGVVPGYVLTERVND